MNLDYSKENKNLPDTLRVLLGQRNRITKSIEYDYLRLFDADVRLAVLNNYNAFDIATGFSQAVHYTNLMTGTAPRLKNILRDKICSRVMIEGDNESINKVKANYSEARLTKDLKIAFDNAIATGRGVMALDYINDKIKIRHFNLFRSKIKFDLTNDIVEADLFLQIKNISAFENFTIIEKRYYNSNNIPCNKYVLAKVQWDKGNSLDSRIDYYESSKIDDRIKKMFEGITFNREVELTGFNTLGVYVIDNDITNTKYPYSNIPQSQFVDVQDLLIEREVSETYKAIDKHFGRGRIIKPSFMKTGFSGSNMVNGNVSTMSYAPMPANNDQTIFTQYESLSMDDSKPQSIQFDLRSEQWRTDINGLIGDICACFGLTILDFDPRLLQAGQRTDDEINAMTDITRASVQEKRDINEEAINTLLNQIALLVGTATPVFIRWSMQNVLNPLKNSQLIAQQLANGTISRKTAIKRENPDYTDKEIDEELALIEQETKAIDINREFDQF